MSSLVVQVQNQTGQTHNYILSQDAVQPPKPLLLANVKVPQEGSAMITLDIPDPYYAYAITYQAPSHGSSVETIAKRPITLGKVQDDGTQTLGTTVQYVVTDKVPDLAVGALPMEGKVNAFEIRTGSDFTEKDAKKGNFLIGYGSKDQPYQGFTPMPASSFQIIPSQVFYLNFVDEIKGATVISEISGNPLKIDFSALDSPVSVLHNKDGEFVIEN
ncbi:hypothetical protein MMC26_002987 [Xylographa opegraphella]|nr:hypothetical protein [Xylographa opegraphella]